MLEVWVRSPFHLLPPLGWTALIAWITYGLTKRQLSELGTGTSQLLSITAANWLGFSVLSEAFKELPP